ncbi:titin isoform X3 [Belonocnema kinseyi]|uniref:titin isoform X3 n=1 Tax=Belonocnema kinseyi TaxID=2817044 RepID=UPI00143D2935|nr:titin isoform X3 [Belonocnema kinseyi]
MCRLFPVYGFAWVTLATNDSYSLGALVLANSLRRAGTPHDLVVLITPGVTDAMREKLSAVFSLVQEVNILDSKDEANLRLLARPELGITFTKLHCWRLTQYTKCVFVDADALVIRNCDELFERDEFSAAPDVGWPDCFNSGVFVFKPSQETYDALVEFATAKGSFDGGDQGLLNMYFSDWAQKDISKHLPFIYNMCSTATYSYLPAFKQFGEDVRIIHFIGATKPWLQYFDTLTGIVQPPSDSSHLQPLLQVWWNIFCDNVHPQLNPIMAGLAGALAKLTLGEPRSNEQMVFEEHMRKMSWEQGQIDYLGRDSFDNIWKKISSTLATGPVREKTPPQPDSAELKKGVTEALAKAEVEKTEKKIPEEVPAVGTDEISEEQKRSVASAPKTTVPVEVQQIPTALEVQKVHEQIPEPAPVTPEPVPKTPVSESVPESPVSEVVQTTPVVPEPVPEILVPEVVQPTPVVPEPVLEPPVPETVPEVVQPTPVVPEPVPEIPVVPEVVPEELKATVVPEVQQTPAVSEAQSAPVPEKIQTTPVAETAAIPEETQETPVAEPVPETPVPEHLQKEEAQEKPVPIQVAESVLHAEPKESVSQVTLPVGEEAISSIVTSAQESALAVSEALIDPATSEPATLEPTAPKFENGSVDPQTEILPSATISCTSDTSEGSTALLARSQNVVSFIPEPIEVPTEEVQPKEKTEETEVQKESEAPTETKTPEDTKAEEPKSERRTSRSFSMEKPLLPVSESKLTVQIPPRQPSEVSGSVEKPEEQTETAASSASGAEIPAESESSDSPARPIRSKEIKAPPTPTIIEATPPTSPQIEPEEEAEGDEKVAKKVVKKVVKKQSTDESEETEGESSGKKVTKKVVKKVVKKKEGEAEGSSPTEKKKVLKKTTAPKSAQLEADKSVPETPPPGSSEVPVPPKRKVKTSTTTKETTSKQPDTEL